MEITLPTLKLVHLVMSVVGHALWPIPIASTSIPAAWLYPLDMRHQYTVTPKVFLFWKPNGYRSTKYEIDFEQDEARSLICSIRAVA
jgi:hypothetical protein